MRHYFVRLNWSESTSDEMNATLNRDLARLDNRYSPERHEVVNVTVLNEREILVLIRQTK